MNPHRIALSLIGLVATIANGGPAECYFQRPMVGAIAATDYTDCGSVAGTRIELGRAKLSVIEHFAEESDRSVDVKERATAVQFNLRYSKEVAGVLRIGLQQRSKSQEIDWGAPSVQGQARGYSAQYANTSLKSWVLAASVSSARESVRDADSNQADDVARGGTQLSALYRGQQWAAGFGKEYERNGDVEIGSYLGTFILKPGQDVSLAAGLSRSFLSIDEDDNASNFKQELGGSYRAGRVQAGLNLFQQHQASIGHFNLRYANRTKYSAFFGKRGLDLRLASGLDPAVFEVGYQLVQTAIHADDFDGVGFESLVSVGVSYQVGP